MKVTFKSEQDEMDYIVKKVWYLHIILDRLEERMIELHKKIKETKK